MSRETIKCTVMFADIAGSTDIYGEYGNAAAKSAIVACVELMAEITRQYKGIVIKTIGDEIMCRFDSATAALDAACRIQEAVNIPFGDMNIVMQVKIGLHEGEAILENNDVFGAAANVAASMAAIAKARQIITTQDTYDLLDPRLQDRSREFDVTAVKGKAGKITIYEIIWNVDDDVTCMAVSPPATEVDTSITLIYKGDSISVHSDQVPFVIGRGAASDLTAEAPLASRSHAKIDYSRGKFVLVDQSTNGTYVKLGDGNEVYLRREELPLRSRGSISLGEKVTEGSPLLVHFTIG